MIFRQKPISEQTIVITGASSGIGLATAKMAASRGARVVLASRNTDALRRAVDEIKRDGGQAIFVSADVADKDEVQTIADVAIREFGGFDTWVNNAGISIFGKLNEVHLEEKRRLFDVNFWGVIHGCRSALPHLKARGGTLINIGSVVSHRAIPLQGIYSASKHAVKAYTDALRMELEEEGAPVNVSLIKPATINTMFFENAKTHMGVEPKQPAPVYAPEVVAEAILACAERPVRELSVGGATKVYSLLETFFPRLTDLLMERTMFSQQRSETPVSANRPNNLYSPPPSRAEGRVSGHYEGHVSRTSLYTHAALHSRSVGVAFLGAVLAAVGAALAGGRLKMGQFLSEATPSPQPAPKVGPVPRNAESTADEEVFKPTHRPDDHTHAA